MYIAKVFIARDECIDRWRQTCFVLEMNTLVLDTNTFCAKDEYLSIRLFLSLSSREHFIVLASYQQTSNESYVDVIATCTSRCSIVNMTAIHNIQVHVLCEKPKQYLKEMVLQSVNSFEALARQS